MSGHHHPGATPLALEWSVLPNPGRFYTGVDKLTKQEFTTQYEALVRAELAPLTQRVTDALKALIQTDFGPDAFALHFEASSMELTDSFPVCWFVFDKDHNLRDDILECELLNEDIPCTISYDLLESEAYVDEILTWDVAFETFQNWFADCWSEAGGLNSGYVAYIQNHDSGWGLDLNTRKECETDSLFGIEPEPDPLPKIPWPKKDEITRRMTPRRYDERVSKMLNDGDIALLDELIADGWDVNYAPFRDDISTLEQAVMWKRIELVRALLERGAEVGIALYIAERDHARGSVSSELIELLKGYQTNQSEESIVVVHTSWLQKLAAKIGFGHKQ